LVKALIEAGADVKKLASPHFFIGKRKRTSVLHNVTPLFDAADKGHTHVVMELIKAGADVNQANSEGATPLYHAAQKGHEGIVVALIQAGVDVRKACKGLGTPMQIATDMKQEKVMALLKFYERV
jgi:ankyrin repeat protein